MIRLQFFYQYHKEHVTKSAVIAQLINDEMKRPKPTKPNIVDNIDWQWHSFFYNTWRLVLDVDVNEHKSVGRMIDEKV